MAAMTRIGPLGALVRGLAAGALGSAVQSQFFKATASITPPTPDVFRPPEPVQKQESSTETVARRAVEQLAKAGELSDEQKRRGGELVHYAFGAVWGCLYGQTRESFPSIASPLGVTAFATTVWMASDNLLLPAMKLAAWPGAYPAKVHLYAWAAHVAFGAAVWAGYELLRPQSWTRSAALLLALRRQSRVSRYLPRSARPAVRRAIMNDAMRRSGATLH
jgi:hypothetical protein